LGIIYARVFSKMLLHTRYIYYLQEIGTRYSNR
jgi:hypothetical protein